MRLTRQWAFWAAALVIIVVLASGFSRLRIDADVFNLLPADSPIVEGLKLYQRSFGTTQELMISLRSPEAQTSERLAQSLARQLQASGLTRRVIWRSPFQEDPAELAELVAYLRFNQSPDAFEALARRFREGQLQPALEYTLERMATSLRPQEVARLGHDPFELTVLPDGAAAQLGQGRAAPFASPDGRFRVLFILSPLGEADFWEYRHWVEAVNDEVNAWRREHRLNGELTVRITGNPAFETEFGSSLLRDVQFAAAGTLILVVILFWLTHRRLAPLAWLVALLVTVLATTVALGGILLGTLHGISLSFAAILLGLATDYGLILYQEHAAHPNRPLAEHRATVGPGILWAAVTTAGAFLMVGRSSLPGLTQLGILVAIGILVAAVVMLAAFLPPLVAKDRKQGLAAGPPESERAEGALTTIASNGWLPWTVTLLLAAGALTLLVEQRPAVDYGTNGLGPKNGEARAALAEIQREVGGSEDGLWLIVHGTDEREVGVRMEQAKRSLDDAVENGMLDGYLLPKALWPDPEAQAANRETARWLAGRLAAVQEAALNAGFATGSLGLTENVFTAWAGFAAGDTVVKPTRPGAQWLFRKFASEESGRLLVLGRLESGNASETELLELAAEISRLDGVQIFGWSLLSESLIEVMERDIKQVLLPAGAVLIVLLGMAFRGVRETALSLATLLFSLACLMSVMVLLDWSWNLANLMALPLVFGAGVDYSIHIQLALRRYHGDVARVRQTVGQAILLCGASTAAAFGTLGFASNAGLAGLGRVTATGVILASLTSVFLLPAWWRTTQLSKNCEPVLESR